MIQRGRRGKCELMLGLWEGWRLTLASCPVPLWLFVAWCVYVTLLAHLSGNHQPGNPQPEEALVSDQGFVCFLAHFQCLFIQKR